MRFIIALIVSLWFAYIGIIVVREIPVACWWAGAFSGIATSAILTK